MIALFGHVEVSDRANFGWKRVTAFLHRSESANLHFLATFSGEVAHTTEKLPFVYPLISSFTFAEKEDFDRNCFSFRRQRGDLPSYRGGVLHCNGLKPLYFRVRTDTPDGAEWLTVRSCWEWTTNDDVTKLRCLLSFASTPSSSVDILLLFSYTFLFSRSSNPISPL